MRPLTTPEVRAHAVERYKRGDPLADIARDCGVSKQLVGNWVGRAGVPRTRHNRRPQAEHDRAVRLYLEGVKLTDIMRELHVNESQIYAWLLKAGVSPNRVAR